MRHSFSSICRLIACFLVMTVLTSGIAMAAYLCPQMAPAPELVMEGMPCAEMDREKPVHCAEFQSGAQLALEHQAPAPSLAPLTVSFVMPASPPAVVPDFASARGDVPPETGTDPPYFRTLRIRI